MAIRPITLYGDSILRKKTRRVDKVDQSIKELVDDMFETMYNAHGMGLAANQVGSDKAIFIVDLSSVKGYENTKPMVFINPKLVEESGPELPMEEGCLSIPDVRAEVNRNKKIVLEYQDMQLHNYRLENEELLARVIQHEYDHLQGVFFTDHLDDDSQKMLKKTLLKIKNRKLEFEYPVTAKDK